MFCQLQATSDTACARWLARMLLQCFCIQVDRGDTKYQNQVVRGPSKPGHIYGRYRSYNSFAKVCKNPCSTCTDSNAVKPLSSTLKVIFSGSLKVDEETTFSNWHGLCSTAISVERFLGQASSRMSEPSTGRQMKATVTARSTGNITSSLYLARKDVLLSPKGFQSQLSWPSHLSILVSGLTKQRGCTYPLQWHSCTGTERCPMALPRSKHTSRLKQDITQKMWGNKVIWWQSYWNVDSDAPGNVVPAGSGCNTSISLLQSPFPCTWCTHKGTGVHPVSVWSSAWSLFNWALCACVNIIPVLTGYSGKHKNVSTAETENVLSFK